MKKLSKKKTIIIITSLCLVCMALFIMYYNFFYPRNGCRLLKSISDYQIFYTGQEENIIKSEKTPLEFQMSFDKDFLKDNEIDYVQMSIEIEENGEIVSESKEKVDIPPTLFLKKEPGSGGGILHMEHAEISYDSTDLSNGTIEIVCKMYNSEDELVEFTYEKVKSRIIIDYSEKDGKLNYDIDYDQPEEYHEQVKARTTIMEIDLKENDIIPRTDDWKLKASVKIPRVHFIKEDGSVYNESSISIYVNPQDEYLMYNQIYEEGILDCDFLYLTEEDILESDDYYIEKETELSFNTENISDAGVLFLEFNAHIEEYNETEVFFYENAYIKVPYMKDEEGNIRYVPSKEQEVFEHLNEINAEKVN